MQAPRILGMDELMLADEMRGIIVDIETSWPIELLPSREQGVVHRFLCTLRGREKVEVVTMDMWKPYLAAVQHAMPQAVVIVDKWHVMRLANDAIGQRPAVRRLAGFRATMFESQGAIVSAIATATGAATAFPNCL